MQKTNYICSSFQKNASWNSAIRGWFLAERISCPEFLCRKGYYLQQIIFLQRFVHFLRLLRQDSVTVSINSNVIQWKFSKDCEKLKFVQFSSIAITLSAFIWFLAHSLVMRCHGRCVVWQSTPSLGGLPSGWVLDGRFLGQTRRSTGDLGSVPNDSIPWHPSHFRGCACDLHKINNLWGKVYVDISVLGTPFHGWNYFMVG